MMVYAEWRFLDQMATLAPLLKWVRHGVAILNKNGRRNEASYPHRLPCQTVGLGRCDRIATSRNICVTFSRHSTGDPVASHSSLRHQGEA